MGIVTASIVTYNTNINHLRKTMEHFFENDDAKEILIWDNSPSNDLEQFIRKYFPNNVRYFHSPKNLGFGRGHNSNFEHNSSDFFCILNPDLYVGKTTLKILLDEFAQNQDLGLLSCRIDNIDGSEQHVHKNMPTITYYLKVVLSLLFRWIDRPLLDPIVISKDKLTTVPLISGCFYLFKSSHYKELGGFDERFFLYFEDYDISLRSYLLKKSAVTGKTSVTHVWQRASHIKLKSFLIHIMSGIKFYGKWRLGTKLSKQVQRSRAN